MDSLSTNNRLIFKFINLHIKLLIKIKNKFNLSGCIRKFKRGKYYHLQIYKNTEILSLERTCRLFILYR